MTGAALPHAMAGPTAKPDDSEESVSVVGMLGPGLVTGAADDDPSGVGTYSQVGAQFGYAMLWTMLFSLPLMLAVQEISARIGRVTGKGIAANLRGFPKWITYPVIFLLFLANTINIGADIAAMGAAALAAFYRVKDQVPRPVTEAKLVERPERVEA